MAELNFPPKASGGDIGDIYTAPNGVQYVWDGYAWKTAGSQTIPELETSFLSLKASHRIPASYHLSYILSQFLRTDHYS